VSTVADLQAARDAAIAAGDKALGREIYHQLLNLGLRPEDIGSRAEAVEAVGAGQFVEEPKVREQETAVPTPVKRGRRKTTSDSA
jgi:hypothetical protein